MIGGVGVIAAVIASSSASARRSGEASEADPGTLVQDTEHRYQLRLSSDWRAMKVDPASRTPQAGYQHRGGATLAINRVDYPNLAAWRKGTFPDYADEVERGFRDAVRDYRRDSRRTHHLGIVPALDLSFRHRGDSGDHIVHVRVLFYRLYSLTIVASIPATTRRSQRRAPRDAVASFQPYLRS